MREANNWLQSYQAFCYESESPEDYHTWVGLATIAGAARRSVTFDMGYFTIYPNLYVVLVSPPGLGMKTTAMSMGAKLLRPVPGISLAAESTSKKQLIVDLKNSKKDGVSALTMYSSELATLMGTSKIEMVVLLTDLFDCPTPKWEHRTETGGIHVIENPFLNLLAGTTPDQFAKAMPLDIIGTGLASRIIFVWADTPRIRPWRPILSAAQVALGKLLSADLQHIAGLRGAFTFSVEAERLYDEWYRLVRPYEAKKSDSRMASYYTRKRIHVIKVMMLMSLAKRDSLVIEAEDVNEALALFSHTELGMPYVYGGVGKNPLAGDINDMLVEMLQRPEGATLFELLDKFKFAVRLPELKEILETLTLTGHIKFTNERYFVVLKE